MWELDHQEGWVPKNWCFQTVMLKNTPESPLECKENKPVNPKGNQPWIFIGRTDAEGEAPILWPPEAKSWFTGKTLTLTLGKIDSKRRRGWQRIIWLDNSTDSRTLIWANSRTMNPSMLQSMGSLRVGHDWATSFSFFTFMHWRRKWQPTPVFLPEESQGWGAGGEGDDRGWDGWMASPTWWIWVWVNSGSWWWAGRPGLLQFMESQRVRHDWATELNWIFHSIYLAHLLHLLCQWTFRLLPCVSYCK